MKLAFLLFLLREVDDNNDYDPLEICDHDEEEKYFDEEESRTPSDILQSYRDSQSSSSSLNVDYDEYEVKDDVCPGLLDQTKTTDTISLKASPHEVQRAKPS